MVTPGEIAEEECDFSISIPIRPAANRGQKKKAVTREGKEKSVQDQRVAEKGRVPGLTSGDSLLVRGGSEGDGREA
jgi:hypothetical protein